MVTGERQVARIRSLYLKALLRQDIEFFDKETNTGEVIERMSADTIIILHFMEKVPHLCQSRSNMAFAKFMLRLSKFEKLMCAMDKKLQVGKFIQLIATFFGGFVIAFSKGWLLTLVLMSSVPPIVIAAGFMAYFTAKAIVRGQASYSEAAIVVEQTIGSIRTVGINEKEICLYALVFHNKFQYWCS